MSCARLCGRTVKHIIIKLSFDIVRKGSCSKKHACRTAFVYSSTVASLVSLPRPLYF